jgi:hypothetical protein
LSNGWNHAGRIEIIQNAFVKASKLCVELATAAMLTKPFSLPPTKLQATVKLSGFSRQQPQISVPTLQGCCQVESITCHQRFAFVSLHINPPVACQLPIVNWARLSYSTADARRRARTDFRACLLFSGPSFPFFQARFPLIPS